MPMTLAGLTKFALAILNHLPPQQQECFLKDAGVPQELLIPSHVSDKVTIFSTLGLQWHRLESRR